MLPRLCSVTMRCENKIYQKWHSLRKSIRMYKTIPEFNRQFMISVSLGLIIGSFITYMLIILNNSHRRITAGPSIDPGSHGNDEEFHRIEDHTVAKKLYEKVRVLCWVMTQPKYHEKRAKHVKATWGKRCNELLFMSSVEDSSLPSIALHGVKEDQEYLWGKTKEAFRYVYKHYLDKADWFLKADDDTYVIVENLRYMLMPYNSSDPIYFGCRFKPYVNQGYMSGGAGYVLSREAVKRFVEISLRNATGCRIHENYGPEDLEIGRCLESAQVKAGDSRDSLGRNRFLPLFPQRHLIPGEMWEETPWYWIYMYYKGEEDSSVVNKTFEYVKSWE
ncbi:unnamed protein product [Acanthoscelides obtectus]|uniref:Glycoprotein-N-acetylgalactosamine 3-beta-galactosyltransferase 1 n=1 Tax=Acanthoscelides obtectus TaxID=200917 RepID=A0A9P0LNB4_ACAOB|nr:unnamed protein product [Acanthoscelides obtectus]CAK1663877.1 Glycoprotein-N-acetylgalactosamine 3-beta-galactosyltransferase 1 [Acanthoscelides obtectus]